MMHMRILYYCHGDKDRKTLHALQQKLPEHHIDAWPDCDNRPEVEAAIVWQPPAEFFDDLINLKHVLSIAAGVDHLLDHPGLPDDVDLVRLTDAGMAQPMAEFVLYGALHAQRRMCELRQAQGAKQWRHDLTPYIADSFRVGLLGAGELGHAAAKRLADNHYPVSCWSRSKKVLPGIQHYAGAAGLDEMLPTVQALVCLLPLTRETHGIINASLLSKLPKNAFIINPGRGDHVDETALLEALNSNHISGALLDVFHEEPLPESHPFWTHPNVIVSPHLAGPTSVSHAVDQIAESLAILSNDGKPAGLVNRQLGY